MSLCRGRCIGIRPPARQAQTGKINTRNSAECRNFIPSPLAAPNCRYSSKAIRKPVFAVENMHICRLDTKTDRVARATVRAAHGEDADLLVRRVWYKTASTDRAARSPRSSPSAPLPPTSIFSGRIPTVTRSPSSTLSSGRKAYHLAVGEFCSNLLALRGATTAGRKFIPGEPMNPATNRLAG